MYGAIIKEVGRGAKGARSLDVDTARNLFADMLQGRVPDLALGALLLSFRIKGESDAELQGFLQALHGETPRIVPPLPGPRVVVFPAYNGARRQPNLMPLVALLLARQGIPVLIQGRHDFDSRADPFALLAALSIVPVAPVAVPEQWRLGRVGCVRVEDWIPGLARLLATRVALGVRSSAHTLAKLIDPAPKRSVRVVAVTHPDYFERMQRCLALEPETFAVLMRATEGEAYAHPRRPLSGIFFQAGVLHTVQAPTEVAAVAGDAAEAFSPEENAALIQAMLAGDAPIPASIQDQATLLAALSRAPEVSLPLEMAGARGA